MSTEVLGASIEQLYKVPSVYEPILPESELDILLGMILIDGRGHIDHKAYRMDRIGN